MRIPREFYHRLRKEALRRGMGFNEYVRHLIYLATENVPLTEEDYDIIKRERQRDLDRQSAKGRLSKG